MGGPDGRSQPLALPGDGTRDLQRRDGVSAHIDVAGVRGRQVERRAGQGVDLEAVGRGRDRDVAGAPWSQGEVPCGVRRDTVEGAHQRVAGPDVATVELRQGDQVTGRGLEQGFGCLGVEREGNAAQRDQRSQRSLASDLHL